MPTVIDIALTSSPRRPKRYPLARLGGRQSNWPRSRSVTTEQTIAAKQKGAS